MDSNNFHSLFFHLSSSFLVLFLFVAIQSTLCQFLCGESWVDSVVSFCSLTIFVLIWIESAVQSSGSWGEMIKVRSSWPSRLHQLLSSEGSIGPSVKLDFDPVSLLFLSLFPLIYFNSIVLIIGKCNFFPKAFALYSVLS